MYDNARPYRAQIVDILKEENIRRMDWHTSSPDLLSMFWMLEEKQYGITSVSYQDHTEFDIRSFRCVEPVATRCH